MVNTLYQAMDAPKGNAGCANPVALFPAIQSRCHNYWSGRSHLALIRCRNGATTTSCTQESATRTRWLFRNASREVSCV